jgi:flavin reductase (DIM6/NTAB) family NADH-FMN oxidoreductase RutF/rubredoxin
MNLLALRKLRYGLYVVGSKKDDKLNGLIANGVSQVSAVPANFVVSINKENLTHEFIKASKVLSFSVLSKNTPLSFIGRFGFNSGREINKFKGVSYKIGKTGAPIVLDNTLAYVEANVINEADLGTHTIFIAQMVDSDIIREGEPMTYDYYSEVKRGPTSKKASLYIEQIAVTKAQKYQCCRCFYIYDPEFGDPDGNVSPGTSFELLPDDWKCPICGASKNYFDKLEGTE